jgi:hypothetical protein
MFSERLLENSFGNLFILFVRMLVDSYVITASVYKRFCVVNVGERRLKGNAAADCRTLQHRHPHHSRDLFPWLPYSQSCITQRVGLLCILKSYVLNGVIFFVSRRTFAVYCKEA